MRVFHGSSSDMLMLAINNYVLPILMYASPIWNPTTVREKVILKNVLRRFTKRLPGYSSLSYEERLRNTSVMSLEDKHFYADLVFTFKCIHKLSGCSLDDIGLSLVDGRTRGAGVRLSQRHHRTAKAASLFKNRVFRAWNSLPLNITSCHSLTSFNSQLAFYIFNSNTNF